MYESPLFWPAYVKGDTLYVLDETLVPSKFKYIPVKDTQGAVTVIHGMKTRAFGQFLVVLNTFLIEARGKALAVRDIEDVARQLNSARPTFPFAEVTGIILGVARKAQANHADVRMAVTKTIESFLAGIRDRRLERVRNIAEAMDDGDCILTHCNVSGELAMAASIAMAGGRRVRFFATETRPYMQGSKLTVWELQKAKAVVTLVPDNTIGSLMAEGLVNKVMIGSDRCAANGDVANKIGSYQIAVLAREFGIPVIVLTQPSKGVKTGNEIPIELRDAQEILVFNGKKVFGPKVQGFYPGFDVVPYQLITKTMPIHAGL